MNDSPADRPDPLRAWLEATSGNPSARPSTGDDGRDRGPSRRLLAVTAVVCATAVALAVAAGQRGQGPAPRQSAAVPAALLPAATPAPAVTPPPVAHAGDRALVAAALLAVRTGAGTDLYVDTAAVEDLSVLGDMAVVTVRALVLRRLRHGWDGWSAPQTARFAVPVSADGVALAPPWRLPAPDAATPAHSWRPVNDPALRRRAGDAVTAAGYAPAGAVRLHQAADLPGVLRVTVRAVAPGDGDPRHHELWLGGGGSAVLGHPAVTPLPVPGEQS